MSKSYRVDYKKFTQKEIILSLILLLVILIVYGRFSLPSTEESKRIARLEIKIGTTERSFEGEVVEGMTVLEALQAAALAGNINLSYRIESNNLIIESLDGYKLSESVNPLSFYLNSSRVESDRIQEKIIEPNDLISVRLE